MFACFIYYEKTFDNVKHDTSIKRLDDIEFYIVKTQTLSNSLSSCQNQTKDIKILKGERQGCILSRILFHLYSEIIFENALDGVKKVIKWMANG